MQSSSSSRLLNIAIKNIIYFVLVTVNIEMMGKRIVTPTLKPALSVDASISSTSDNVKC